MLTINNTLDGYLKDVEILGNTIQNEEDLADIRSVGEKVEGQELYEIPVLSVGKNLLDYKLFNEGFEVDRRIGSNGGTFSSSGYKASKLIEIPRELKGKTLCQNWYGCFATYSSKSETSVISRRFNTELIVIEDNAKYFRIDFPNSNENKLQLEEGTVATEYEPYQEDKLTILSPVQLEKVGDVADRIICKDGVWGVEKNVKTIYTKEFYSRTFSYENKADTFLWKLTVDTAKTNLVTNFMQSGKLSTESSQTQAMIYDHTSHRELRLAFNKSDFPNFNTESNVKEYLSDVNKYIKIVQSPTFIPLPHDQQVKLRTFANKTNISFLTEIEGTIKAQVPRSLGATVNTHTTQISNLNKELDRVKKLEESTVSTVTTESDFTTVEATSNGYFEDVKLEGKTLVNLANKLSGHWVNSAKTAGTIDLVTIQNLSPDKYYTLYAFGNSFDGQLKNNQDSTPISDGHKGNTPVLFKGIEDCNFKYYVTGASELTVEYLTDIKIIILEGDHTQNPPSYFEGLKSVGQGTDEIVVSSVNENLFDEDNVIFATIGTNYGVVEKIGVGRYRYIGSSDASKNWGISFNQVKLPPNSNFSISFKKDIKKSNYERLYIKSSSGSVILDKVVDSREFNFTTGVDDTYIFSFYCGNGTVANIEFELYDVCIKNKHSNFEYTPHQSDKKRLLFYNEETQTWEKPILREWDSIEKHANGKYYYHQRSAEVVLNGSESNISMHQPSNSDLLTFRLNDFCNDGINSGGIICNNFKNDITSGLLNKANGCRCAEYSSIVRLFLCLEKSKLSTQDVQGFKQWLQTNPVTVVYQLAQEKVYECTNIDLITYANETNYIVNSGAIVPRTTLKVHNNISNVVSLLQKKVSLLESNMTKYMITQNRMQLASTYSADSVTFKVDYALCSEEVEYNEDLYNLILNNILVGKDNYDYDHMFTMILDYASWNQISWEQFDILVGLMDMQHNPPVEEIPTENEVIEETPNEIM